MNVDQEVFVTRLMLRTLSQVQVHVVCYMLSSLHAHHTTVISHSSTLNDSSSSTVSIGTTP